MALKPDREEFHYDVSHFMDAVAEMGGVVSVKTGGSGGYPGNAKAVVEYKADPSGAKPVGLLLYDVVSYDTNRQHENWQKSGFQARVGQKVALIRDGWVTTNMISGTPAAGDDAYLAASGLISNTQATGAPRVGRFKTSKDQDGYAAVFIDL